MSLSFTAKEILRSIIFLSNHSRPGIMLFTLKKFTIQLLQDIIFENYQNSLKDIEFVEYLFQLEFSGKNITEKEKNNIIKNLSFLKSEIENTNKAVDHQSISDLNTDQINKDIDITDNNPEDDYQENIKDLNSEIRQLAIIEKIRKFPKENNRFCGLKDLMTAFPEVSDRTLRYDLQKLANQNVIIKIGSRGPQTAYRLTTETDKDLYKDSYNEEIEIK